MVPACRRSGVFSLFLLFGFLTRNKAAFLAASETVPAGTTLDFEVLVMNPKDAETVREWLDYGQLRGLFQWRNSGKGRFTWEEVED